MSDVIREETLAAMCAKLRALAQAADFTAAGNPDSLMAQHLRATLALALDQAQVLLNETQRARGQRAMQGLQRTLEEAPSTTPTKPFGL